jgi:sugar O-acyltransferase (sialic acid O-acetyltransferase NeuD family)
MMEGRFILVGAGAYARELIDWAYDTARAGTGREFDSFLDERADVFANQPYQLEWLGTEKEFVPRESDRFVIAIGDPKIKRKVVAELKSKGAIFANLIHPSAVIARTAQLGEGVVLCPQAMVSANAKVGDFVTVNSLCSVGHDVVLGDYSTLSSHVDLTGYVNVGEEVFFGSGAKVLPKVRIADKARIGAGTLIMKSVAEGAVMYVLPSKRL